MEKEEETMERTKCALLRHLEDLNDQVDADGGRIRDPMVREDIRDCVRTLRWIGCMERERTPARASAVSAARQ